MISDAELSLISAQHQITTSATEDGGERYGCSCGFAMIVSGDRFRDRLSAHVSRAHSRRALATHIAEQFASTDDGAEFVEQQMLCEMCNHALDRHDPDYGRCLDPGCHVGREQCRRTADARGSFIPIWQEG